MSLSPGISRLYILASQTPLQNSPAIAYSIIVPRRLEECTAALILCKNTILSRERGNWILSLSFSFSVASTHYLIREDDMHLVLNTAAAANAPRVARRPGEASRRSLRRRRGAPALIAHCYVLYTRSVSLSRALARAHVPALPPSLGERARRCYCTHARYISIYIFLVSLAFCSSFADARSVFLRLHVLCERIMRGGAFCVCSPFFYFTPRETHREFGHTHIHTPMGCESRAAFLPFSIASEGLCFFF